MQLLDREFELEQEYEIKKPGVAVAHMDRGVLLNDVLSCLWNLLYSSGVYQYVEFCSRMVDTIGTETGRHTFMLDNEEYTGDLSYRIRKYMELKGIIVRPSYKSMLNSRISFQTQRHLEDISIIFSDTIDWQPGDFYEPETSCWWDNRYSDGKASFMNHMRQGGGFAIKVYHDDGRHLGRCFGIFIPNTTNFMLFNIYMDDHYAYNDFLNTFADYLGAVHRNVSLHTYNANMYINGDDGHAFAKQHGQLRDDYRIRIYNYEAPYDPDIERLRLSQERYPMQHACQRCNRYYESRLTYVKPHKLELCSNCIYALNISLVGPAVVKGRSIYYDRNYYKRSKVNPQKYVRIAGKTWETN